MPKHIFRPKGLKLPKIFHSNTITTVVTAIIFLALTFLPISVPKSALAHPGSVTDSFTNKDYIALEEDVTVDITGEGEVRLWAYGDAITFTYRGSPVTYGTVESLGECWMDRNLGATKVATVFNDCVSYPSDCAYGDLFQWGRLDDGHQDRTSGTTTDLSNSDDPEHSDFIYGMGDPFDWRAPQNHNLWQGVSGTNNPCPSGWRIPTLAEWDTERASWSQQNYYGAYASPLKLTATGSRNWSNATLYNVGVYGFYLSSTVSGTKASYLSFLISNAYMSSTLLRASGLSVRCLKDLATSQGTLTSTNLLEGISDVGSIDSFIYTASVPDGTSLKVQFSQDGSTWCDASGDPGTCDGLHDGILTTGTEIIFSLSDLGWSGPDFYYKAQFTSGSTPTLDEISVSYSAAGEGEAVPEFTTLTAIIAFVLGFGIYLLIKRKNSRKG